MKKRIFIIIPIVLFISLFSCSKDERKEDEILSRINGYQLTLSEFQSKLAEEVEMDSDFKLTREARENFLEEIIKKELLIQEAKRQNLDKEERFMRSIERFWEATLIRDLMERKGEEIISRMVISQEEIMEYYESMKKNGRDLPPLDSMEDDIKVILREQKKTEKLKEWIDDLRNKAKVDIDRELLFKR